MLNGLLPRNAFARSVSVLVGGTVGAQILMVLSAPLLTRLYTPEEFGLLAVYAGLLALFSVIASLRYELAIPLPESDASAANLSILSLLMVAGITLISTGVVGFAGSEICNLLGVPELSPYLWLLPLGVLLAGSYQVLSKWAVRKKAFSNIARTRIYQASAMLAIQLLCYKFGALALLAGQACSQGVGAGSLGRYALKWPAFRLVTLAGLGKVLSRYKRFPLFDTWYGIFFTAGQQLPALMFAALFSPMAAGLYMLAHRVLALPMTMIGSAIGSVFFSNAAEARLQNKLPTLFVNVVEKLFAIATPAAMMLLLIGPDLFSLIFGEPWRVAGIFAQLMAVWLLFHFVASPLTTLFAVLEKQKHGAAFQANMLITRILGISVGYSMQSVEWAVGLFSLASAVSYILMVGWMAVALGVSVRSLLRCFLFNLMRSTVLLSPLIFALIVSQEIWITGIGFTSSMCLIAAFYWRQLRGAYR